MIVLVVRFIVRTRILFTSPCNTETVEKHIPTTVLQAINEQRVTKHISKVCLIKLNYTTSNSAISLRNIKMTI